MQNIAEIIEQLKTSERYGSFQYLDAPVQFDEYFKDKPYDIVQIHDISPIQNTDAILGFVGQCEWDGQNVWPFDGDSYTKHMPVWGYSEFETNGLKCIDILVEEW